MKHSANNKCPHYAVLLCILIFAVSGCTAAPEISAISIKQLVFLNRSSTDITNARLYVTKTKEYVTCGYVPKNKECSTGFPLREYKGNRFTLAWEQNRNTYLKENILIAVAEDIDPSFPVRAVITFYDQAVDARLTH